MKLQTFISKSTISSTVSRLGKEIRANHKGPITLLSVLKGSICFTSDLMRELDGEVKICFTTVSSYSGKSSGRISYDSPNPDDITDSNVIIVEDIADTGKTLDFLISQVRSMNAKTVQTCVLLDKPSRREIPVTIDYLGHTIQDLFVVGYGMDFKGRFRNLPYIGIID
ncbi:MAG: hypoxanthine phosphoribosyltransferase [SAR202 cluster bacterium]|nr:hypoxanthine phosphoribosyltransferase [SAR202 cluster bacterium]|tara:strand:+ start:242 stop:745 length:504 start_codon:yes stop_codon:yes gene_type:complete